MKDIIEMVESFKIKRLCETIYGYKPHDAIIGEWIRWWLSDSRLGEAKRRRIINPAIAMTQKKKRVADLLFAEQARTDSDFFKILGVAEIENNSSEFFQKLRVLSLYEQANRERRNRKFPDLKFSVLCCRIWMILDDQEDMRPRKANLIEDLATKSKMYSKDSDLYWILYLLKYAEVEIDHSFRVKDYVEGYRRFWYSRSFLGSEFYIHKNGELQKHSIYNY